LLMLLLLLLLSSSFFETLSSPFPSSTAIVVVVVIHDVDKIRTIDQITLQTTTKSHEPIRGRDNVIINGAATM
jgi:hypothetical protein